VDPGVVLQSKALSKVRACENVCGAAPRSGLKMPLSAPRLFMSVTEQNSGFHSRAGV